MLREGWGITRPQKFGKPLLNDGKNFPVLAGAHRSHTIAAP